MTVEVLNCGPFSDERKHLITSVTWAAGDPSPVAIQGRTLRETEDTVADTSTGVTSWGKRVLREGVGSINNPQADVMRLQGIVGVEKTGVFGPTTTAAVKRWQFINSLGIETIALPPATGTTIITDGIIDADDWAIILGVPMSPRETLSSNHAQPPGIITTAGALQIDDIDDADKKWYR
jgi:peptidoglycan hydrolase-like protein with peptidoglycan-binding domain